VLRYAVQATDPNFPASKTPDRFLRVLMGIAIVGLIARAVPVLLYSEHPALLMQNPDSWGYHDLAANLVLGNGYSWDERPPYTPNMYRPPGLPLLLTSFYAVFGATLHWPAGFQALIGAFSIVLTGVLALRLTGCTRVAALAAAALAVDPLSIIYSTQVLTETYTAVILLLALTCLSLGWDGNQRWWVSWAFLILGLGVLLHPILLFAPVLLYLLVLIRDRKSLRGEISRLTLLLVLAFVPALMWCVRNYAIGDYFGVSVVSSVNLLKYKAAGVMAELRGTNREIERDRLVSQIAATLPGDCSDAERLRAWRREGIKVILAHPLTYSKIHVRGVSREILGMSRDLTWALLIGPGAIGEGGRVTDSSIDQARRTDPRLLPHGAVISSSIILQFTVLLFALLGLICLLFNDSSRSILPWIVIPAIYVMGLTGGPEADPRFRVIYQPLLCVAFAVGAIATLQIWRPCSDWIYGRFYRISGEVEREALQNRLAIRRPAQPVGPSV